MVGPRTKSSDHEIVAARPVSTHMRRRWFAFLVPVAILIAAASAPQRHSLDRHIDAIATFDVSFPLAAHSGPITGRVFVIVSRDASANDEPRLQVGRTGAPFFGRDVEHLRPDQIISLDAHDTGWPVETVSDIPAGDCYVQALVSLYTEFHREDGHVVWLHADQWEGQQWNRSPGNLISGVKRIHVDAGEKARIRLVADRVLPPIDIPTDTAFVRRIRIESRTLTKFWGRPIYLGAVVLLPSDYDVNPVAVYPVNYIQSHFSLDAPYGFDGRTTFSKAWLSRDFPRMIAVTLQHPTPYFDSSYLVNSENNGPYADAIIHEMIPELERRFRIRQAPVARIVSGSSTGGWEAAALQIFHPDFFGGAWVYCPDPITFTDVEGVNIYTDQNAFYKLYGWRRVPTANGRLPNGQMLMTSEQRYRFEQTAGSRGRSGEQLDAWAAAFGRVGADGYPELLVDKRTGEINQSVAVRWSRFDLLRYLQNHWAELGPKLRGRLFLFVGDADTYFLDNPVRQLEQWLRGVAGSQDVVRFSYGHRQPHCWMGDAPIAERLREMAAYLDRRGIAAVSGRLSMNELHKTE
jgi:putative esterase